MKSFLLLCFTFIFLPVWDPCYGEAPPPPATSGGARSAGGSKSNLPVLYFGGLVGIGYPPTSIGATSRLNLGGTFAFRITQTLGLGIYYMQALKNEATGLPFPYDKSMIKIVAYGGEFNYWFKVDRFAFRIGYRMGPSQIAIDAVAVNAGATNPTHFGPVVSTDLFLGKEVSVGFEGVFLFFGDIVENAPFVTYYVNSALKVWF